MSDHSPQWRKSSYCADLNCVEVAMTGNLVTVRDGKNTDQPHLCFTPDQWHEFLDRIIEDRLLLAA